jgi:hypothetical protein
MSKTDRLTLTGIPIAIMLDIGGAAMSNSQKSRIFRKGRSHGVRTVFVERNRRAGTITVSERPPCSSLDEIIEELDSAGGADFNNRRDMSPLTDRESL